MTSSKPAGIPTDPETLKSFERALNAIHKSAAAKVGDEDLRRIRRIDRFSQAMQVVGRTLIHFSFEPVSFLAGVGALFVHKQIQAVEVGHSALHGQFDRIPGAGKFISTQFRWDAPADEECYREGHNIRHHSFTNVAGKDADIHFGPVRMTEHTPWTPKHRYQLASLFGLVYPMFGAGVTLHFSGVWDIYFGNDRPERFDIIKQRDVRTVVRAHYRALRKLVPYYFKNYVVFPALAGPFFPKVLLGNMMAELACSFFTTSANLCSHIGEDVATFEAGTQARSKGEWYAMQAAATNNFAVGPIVSILCGGLDYQIEHHLFPMLPPNRTREIAPLVQKACEDHGVPYRRESWGKTLRKSLKHIARMSKPTAKELGARDVHRVAPARATLAPAA